MLFLIMPFYFCYYLQLIYNELYYLLVSNEEGEEGEEGEEITTTIVLFFSCYLKSNFFSSNFGDNYCCWGGGSNKF